MEELSPGEAFVTELCARVATNLGRLCRAEIGDRCQMIGVQMELTPHDPPSLSAELACRAPDMDCPGLFLVEPAANEAAAQMRTGDGPDS